MELTNETRTVSDDVCKVRMTALCLTKDEANANDRFVFIYSNKKKTRCTSRYGCTTSLAFYELEYTNYVGNIIPHAITSLM